MINVTMKRKHFLRKFLEAEESRALSQRRGGGSLVTPEAFCWIRKRQSVQHLSDSEFPITWGMAKQGKQRAIT